MALQRLEAIEIQMGILPNDYCEIFGAYVICSESRNEDGFDGLQFEP
jgi:hypothetical protein